MFFFFWWVTSEHPGRVTTFFRLGASKQNATLRAQLRNFGAQPVLRPPEVISSHGFPATNFQIDIEPSRRACGDPSRRESEPRIVG